MKLSGQRGFGLLLMIILITLSAIMIGGITVAMTNASALGILRVNQVRAYYVAHSAIMRSFKDFDASFDTDDALGNYKPLVTNTGIEFIRTNFQSNFAAFTADSLNFNAEWWPLRNPPIPDPPNPQFPPQPNLWCEEGQVNMNYRLHGWTVQNIRTSIAGTTDNIVVTGMRVSWTGAADLRVSQIRLNSGANHRTGGNAVFAGAGVNGALLNLTGPAARRTLTPDQRWTGPCTYIQWNGAMPDNSRVAVQWTFADGSTSHEVVFWDGFLNGTGRPHIRTFSITGTGEVRMPKFGAMKRLRATFSYDPEEYDHNVRVLGWENLDR